MIDLLACFGVYCTLFFVAALIGVTTIGVLLLIDWIFKTNIGRKVCRWIIND